MLPELIAASVVARSKVEVRLGRLDKSIDGDDCVVVGVIVPLKLIPEEMLEDVDGLDEEELLLEHDELIEH